MPNRFICEVLEEMRSCVKTQNYSYLPGLIEEVQSMANRMEAALGDQKELRYLHKRIKAAKQELKEIEQIIEAKEGS